MIFKYFYCVIWYWLQNNRNRDFFPILWTPPVDSNGNALTKLGKQPFLKIKFANKGVDALNLSNISCQKSVQSNIPPYFEYKELPCLFYSYTSLVATKIFNYKSSLQQIDFHSLSQNPLPCSCSGSEFLNAPCVHIVTGDLNIVRNDKLRHLLRKGPKYTEPVSFSWHQNFDISMDACKAYARRWAKKEDVEVDKLSECIKSIGDVLKRRIRRLKHSVKSRHESIFSEPYVVTELSRLHEKFVLVPADKASNYYTFVCKRYYFDILIEEIGFHSIELQLNLKKLMLAIECILQYWKVLRLILCDVL